MTQRVLAMLAKDIYDLYVAKVQRKGRSEEDLIESLCWLTGHTPNSLAATLESGASLGDFVSEAPWNPAAELITGSICGVKVQEISDPQMRRIRQADKIVDELAKGWPIAKIQRHSENQ